MLRPPRPIALMRGFVQLILSGRSRVPPVAVGRAPRATSSGQDPYRWAEEILEHAGDGSDLRVAGWRMRWLFSSHSAACFPCSPELGLPQKFEGLTSMITSPAPPASHSSRLHALPYAKGEERDFCYQWGHWGVFTP
jgi:hypothetical protein